MREYMISLGAVMMLIAFSSILINEGGIKKFASMAMGFILISTAITPLPGGIKEIEGIAENFVLDDEEIAKAQAQYKAKVIERHRENIEKQIEEKMVHGSKAYVEVTQNGEIISVTLKLLGDESAALGYIVDTLKVPRERIKLSYENN